MKRLLVSTPWTTLLAPALALLISSNAQAGAEVITDFKTDPKTKESGVGVRGGIDLRLVGNDPNSAPTLGFRGTLGVFKGPLTAKDPNGAEAARTIGSYEAYIYGGKELGGGGAISGEFEPTRWRPFSMLGFFKYESPGDKTSLRTGARFGLMNDYRDPAPEAQLALSLEHKQEQQLNSLFKLYGQVEAGLAWVNTVRKEDISEDICAQLPDCKHLKDVKIEKRFTGDGPIRFARAELGVQASLGQRLYIKAGAVADRYHSKTRMPDEQVIENKRTTLGGNLSIGFTSF